MWAVAAERRHAAAFWPLLLLLLLLAGRSDGSQVVFANHGRRSGRTAPAPAPVAATDRRTGHWRPQVHFTAPANWLNDPNGLFRDADGIWHLYYQYGYSPWPEVTKAWGHATSTDLFTWTDHPIAIPDTPSEGSIWSGSVVVDRANTSAASSGADTVLAYFTSWKGPEEAQYLAFSLDGGYTFTPYIGNPLISLSRHGFRDPKVEFHAPTGRWIMVLTLMDYVVFYASTDFYHWDPVSVFHPYPGLGGIECPQLVRVARRRSSSPTAPASAADAVEDHAYLLVLSLYNGGQGGRRSIVKYIVGSFDGTYFIPDPSPDAAQVAYEFDFGPDVYATAFFHMPYSSSAYPKSVYSPAETNLVSVSWASSLVYAGATPTAGREGWRHCMSAVKEHWVDAETNRLVTAAVPFPPALFASSAPEIRHSDQAVPEEGTGPFRLNRDRGRRGQSAAGNPAVSWTFRVRAPRNVSAGVELSFASAGGEAVSMGLHLHGTGKARLTLARAGMRGWQAPDWMRSFAADDVGSVPHDDSSDEFTVTGVMDRSIVEVYADGGLTAGTLAYFANGVLSDISVRSLRFVDGLRFDFEARELRSVWEARDESGDEGGDEMGEL